MYKRYMKMILVTIFIFQKKWSLCISLNKNVMAIAADITIKSVYISERQLFQI